MRYWYRKLDKNLHQDNNRCYGKTMNRTIFDAIKSKTIIEFLYDGHKRIVEPHAYGLSHRGKELLCCYQIGGISHSDEIPCWRLMDVGNIDSIKVLTKHFSGTRKGYRKGDKRMSTIFCEL